MNIIKIIVFCIFSCCILSAAEVVFLQSTDIHGQIAEESYQPGIERIGAKIQEYRKKYGNNLIVFDCGDLTQGSYSATIDHGKSMIQAINYLKYDFWVPGNHDFDYGIESLCARIREFKGTVLLGNVELKDAPVNVKRWMLLHRNGKKIAVIGFAPPFLPHWIAPAQLAGSKQIPLDVALSQIMPEVKKVNPDLVFVAIHIGEFIPGRLLSTNKRVMLYKFFQKYPEIKLVFGGHTHLPTKMTDAGYYMKFIQAPALSEGLACVTVDFPKDKTGQLVFSGSLIPVGECDPEAELDKMLNPHRDKSKVLRKKVIAKVPYAMGGDSKFGEILGKSLLQMTDADAALCVRMSDFRTKPGKIRDFQIFLLIPYENYISVLTVGADDMKAILREQTKLKQRKLAMILTSDRVRYNKKTGKLYLDGMEWNDSSTKIRLVLTSYAASGAGGRYPILRETANRVIREEKNATLRDAFRVWLQKNFK